MFFWEKFEPKEYDLFLVKFLYSIEQVWIKSVTRKTITAVYWFGMITESKREFKRRVIEQL